MDIGEVVTSKNGRDAGKSFIVIATENEYSKIANGKTRRLEKPKLKKNKHLNLETKSDNSITEKIESNKITNNEIRTYLSRRNVCQKMT